MKVKWICSDTLKALRKMPDESVNCCITSPPYWALRDYGTATWEGGNPNCQHKGIESRCVSGGKGKQYTNTGSNRVYSGNCKCGAKRIDRQLGLEKTFEEYIDKLCGIYDEVWRVLRKDGTCWVNMGTTIRSKCDCMIPERFAIEMVNRGWIKRRTIIWHKNNPMPSSTKDDFTLDFEYVYFFVKSNKALFWVRPDGKMTSTKPDSKKGREGLDWKWGTRKGKPVKRTLWKGYSYWFEPQYEPFLTESNAERPRMGQGDQTKYRQKRGDKIPKQDQLGKATYTGFNARYQQPPLGRNKRTVWTIPTQAYPDAHFATFPEKLVEPMILAGCPEFVCTKCGMGRRKAYEKIGENKYTEEGTPQGKTPTKMKWNDSHPNYNVRWWSSFKEIGYTDCGCNAGWIPGVALDPFCGSGTTCIVAFGNGRDSIGVDLKPDYLKLAQRRLIRYRIKRTKAKR